MSKDFVARRPVFIPYHRGGQRLHIGMQQLRDDLSARSRALQNDIISSLSSMKTKIASTFGGADQGSAAEAEGGGDEVNPHTALVMERVTGSKHGRIDFMLQVRGRVPLLRSAASFRCSVPVPAGGMLADSVCAAVRTCRQQVIVWQTAVHS